MRLDEGRVVLRRSWRGGRISFLNVTRVVAHNQQGVLLWVPVGAAWGRIRAADGREHHDAPIDELGEDATLVAQAWQERNVLMWLPAQVAHAVWWFWDARTGEFQGWKADLQDPYVPWDDGEVAGVDTADHALDVMVRPDRSWVWKDEDEFAAKTGHPLYWTAADAAGIRGEGERLVERAEEGTFPFDGTWCDFRPDPSWTVPAELPAGWDRARAA